MTHRSAGRVTDSGGRPDTGPGALCWCGCREEIPERKPGGKRRTKKDTQYINANHRLRGKKPQRRHVVSYPGEHCSEGRAARCQAQSRRSLLETGQPSVSDLIAAWWQRQGFTEGGTIIDFPVTVTGPLKAVA
jgi:hypothetical protein